MHGIDLPPELQGHPEWYSQYPSVSAGVGPTGMARAGVAARGSSYVFYLDPDYADFEPGVSKLKCWTESGPGGRVGPMLLLLLLTMALAVSLVGRVERDDLYRAQGREMVARVTGCRMVKSGRSSSRPQVSYTYQVDGREYEGNQSLSGSCGNYPIRSHISGMYLASQPRRSELLITAEQLAAPLLVRYGSDLAVLGVFGAFMALSAWFFVTALRRHWRLEANGKLIEGMLLEIRLEETSFRTGRKHYVHVQYQFQNPEGITITRYQSQRREDLRDKQLPPPGTPVQVLYADDAAIRIL